MQIYKKHKRFISLVCVVALLLSMVGADVGAADTNRVTASTSASTKQGNYYNCYISIDSTEGLAALEVTVHFNPEKVRICDVYNSVSCTLYDSATNTDNIQISYLMDGVGSASATRLFYFQYQVLSDAAIGDSYFDITVGEAVGKAEDGSLNDVAVSGSRCSFTIAEIVQNKTCSVYGSSTMSTAISQEFTLSYRFSTNQIASGTAVITYDAELFEVVAVESGAFLNGKVVDINTELTGEIYISFVGTEYSSGTNLVTVTFKTIKNVTESSKITLKTTELLDVDLNSISCSGYTTSVNIAYDSTYTGDAPEMRLDGIFSYENKQVTLVVSLEADSHLGAGDFVINFDPELVSYQSCEKGFTPSLFYIDDKKVEEGQLKFHILSTTDIVTEETVLTIVFDVNHPYGCETVDFILDGTGLTNSLTESILLNFIDESVWLEYLVIFRDEDGTILQSAKYHYGDPVEEPPTPTRESAAYRYLFAGWDKEVVACTEDAVYTATYTCIPNEYTVTFVDEDGTVLQSGEAVYGETPTYTGETPVKAATAEYTYTFAGWAPEIVAVSEDATYTAAYTATKNSYTITWEVDGETYTTIEAVYGEAITAPTEVPNKENANCIAYTFAGWEGFTDGMLMPAEELTFVAQFSESDGHTYGNLVPAQTEVHTQNELKPTVEAHYFCDVCDTYFTEGKVATTLEVLTGKNPQHSFGSWITTDDAKHWKECSCGLKAEESSHSFTIEVAGSKIPATCMSTGTVTVQCSCGAAKIQSLEIDKTNHTGNNHIVGAKTEDCGNSGYTGDTVCECGVTIQSGTSIPATGKHIPNADDGDCTTAITCSVCSKETTAAKASHTGGTATCTAQAICTVCGKAYGGMNPANHTGIAQWNQTADTHSQIWSCCGTVVVEEESHHWNNSVCTECGYGCSHTGGEATCKAQAVCSKCGQSYGELNVNNHTGKDHIVGAQAADCGNPGYTGDTVCECGVTIQSGTSIPATGNHTPNADDGDCTTAITCSVCGKETTPAKAHTPNADDGDCTTAITCSVCGKETTAAKAHTPNADDGDCTTAITCSVCGKETTPAKAAHTGGTATCTAQANCTVCGKAYGELAEHVYGDWITTDADKHWKVCSCGQKAEEAAHVYDGDKDTDCNVCGHERILDHEHTFETTWSKDENYHWHAAACGHEVTSGMEAHEWSAETYTWKETGCTVSRTCVDCGYAKTESVVFAVVNGVLTMNYVPANLTLMIAGYNGGQMSAIQMVDVVNGNIAIDSKVLNCSSVKIFFLNKTSFDPMCASKSIK